MNIFVNMFFGKLNHDLRKYAEAANSSVWLNNTKAIQYWKMQNKWKSISNKCINWIWVCFSIRPPKKSTIRNDHDVDLLNFFSSIRFESICFVSDWMEGEVCFMLFFFSPNLFPWAMCTLNALNLANSDDLIGQLTIRSNEIRSIFFCLLLLVLN